MELDAPILVIDDEPQIRRAVRNALRDVSERVIEATTGGEGIDLCAAQRPSLVVLDLGLPDMQGAEVCREIRRWSDSPILVLTARHSEQEKVTLFDAGADDYVTKPFSVLELAARARVHLRRARAASESAMQSITARGLVIDLPTRRVEREGQPVRLTRIEWLILATLVRAGGRTLTHQQIFDAVWGREFGSPQQYLRVHITNLRRKIEVDPASPELIVTEPGVGYRFEVPR
ncbi:MAG: response regulator transcription factor [Gemmatimonadaceae bacterium]|nr:response regulator transcription factor [Gemmatimonadaceae bacterium]